MRFLVDANLPPALAEWLRSQGHFAVHAIDVGLASSPDRAVWAWAKSNQAIIVSKDEDFVMLRIHDPAGPTVLWIRFGNCSRHHVIARMAAHWTAISDALLRGEGVIEVR